MKLNTHIAIAIIVISMITAFAGEDYSTWKEIHIKNHPKAPGIELSIKVPPEWEVSEGERPHVVKKAICGYQSVLIMVKDLGISIPDFAADSFLTEESIKEALPPNSELHKFFKTKLEGLPAFIVNYSTVVERLGMSLFTFRLDCHVVKGRNYLCLQAFYVIPPEAMADKQKIAAEGAKYPDALKTYMKIFNSLVHF